MTSDWLKFVKAHKNMRTSRGLLDLKAISKLWRAKRTYDPKFRVKTKSTKRHVVTAKSQGKPRHWFDAMVKGIKARSDVRNPYAIVNRIWAKLTPAKRLQIQAREKRGERFIYDLPLPKDTPTRGVGTVRTVQPFNLGEVQVNVSASDYLNLLKSKLFSKMRRNDGTTCLVKRCKSKSGNVNMFIDKAR